MVIINNIKRFINKNQKLIIFSVFVILFFLFIIYTLNSYYENKAKKEKEEIDEDKIVEQTYTNGKNYTADKLDDEDVKDLSSNTLENTMKLFVNYCNKGDAEKAYSMLTDECKNALNYRDADVFKIHYIDERFNEPQEYSLVKWSQDGNNITCLITFNGDLLAAGGKTPTNQEYYTFVKNDNTYKINVNNYIYGEDRNVKYAFENIDVKVKHIDVFDKYEEITMEITNNSSKSVAFVKNQFGDSIYLKNSKDTTYPSMNSIFDEGDVVISANNTMTYTVRFNKLYSSSNKAKKIVLKNVVYDYDEYLENKENYSNIQTIEVQYN